MAATTLVGQQWYDALTRYVEGLQAETLNAARSALGYLQDQVQSRAHEDAEWANLADDITVWSQEGRLWIGVNNLAMVSEAFGLEYGDEVRPPNPLFRTLTGEVQAATRQMGEQMQTSGYAQDFKPATVPGMAT